ncbi:MAG: hypothetical protein JWP92_2017 [Caulobacter sp.]|nr:hypothetical protein [Caulobacter sp.]
MTASRHVLGGLWLALTLSACATTPAYRHVAGTGSAADLAAVAALQAAPATGFEPGRFTDGAITLPYRLLSPAPAPGRRYPLVLVLHGSGAIGVDNQAQLGPFLKGWAAPGLEPAFVVAPQVPARSANYQPGGDGLLASVPGPPLASVLALVDDLSARLPIDPRRVYVVGFSMGGSAALNALLPRPDRFAAAVAFSPVPPDRDMAGVLAHTPILLVHGARDDENPIEPDRAMFAALKAAGGRARFIEYDTLDHRVPPDMLVGADWRRWLLAQKRR